MQLGTKLKALSNVYGKIEQLLLVFPGNPAECSREFITGRFGNLFQAFGDRVTFVVLSNYTEELDSKTFLEARESFIDAFQEALSLAHLHPDHHLVHLPAPMATARHIQRKEGNQGPEFQQYFHSDFIQDPFLVMQDDHGNSALLESYQSLNLDNQYVAEQVAAATGILLRPTELWIEGGNVLVGSDFALVGRDLLIQNRDLLFPGKDLEEELGGKSKNAQLKVKDIITATFKRQLGVRYLEWVGEETQAHPGFTLAQGMGYQPFFHIDLFITLGGLTRDGDELVMVAQIDPGAIQELKPEHRPGIDLLNQMLTNVVLQLNQSGRSRPGPRFEVIRLPMGGEMIPDEGKTRFVPFSYNNCQVEWYHGVKRIYMPKYPSTATLEQELREDIGSKLFPPFEFIDYGLEDYCRDAGSFHCMTKVLNRSKF